MTADKIATLRTAKAKSFAIAEELQNRPNPSNKKGQNDRPLHVFAANQTYSNKVGLEVAHFSLPSNIIAYVHIF